MPIATAVAELAHSPLEKLCDELLARLAGNADDDIALLALRCGGRGSD